MSATGVAARLPARVRVLFASASVAGNALTQTWALWLLYFYAPPSGADIETRVPEIGGLDARVVLGATLTAARVLEAIDDPLIGYWTDRTRSRWGRRIPFVLFGTPWWCLLFVLLFLPPDAGASGVNLAYVFVVAMIFFAMSNVASAAMEALLPHLARTNEDRVSVATWQLVFGVSGAAVGLSLSSLLVDLVGFAWMAATIAAIALTARYTALAGTWRFARTDDVPSTPGFRLALTNTFRNRNFLAYLPSFVCFQVGSQLLTALIPFYVAVVLSDVTVFGFNGRDDEGTFSFMLTIMVIAGILVAVPFFAALARRRGKAAAYRTAMLSATLYLPLLFFAGFLPGVPSVVQAVAMIFLAGLPIAGVFLFPNIITADIADDDARRTGTRREAMFYGSQNLVEKLATSLAPLLFALVLLAGDSADDPLGVRLVGPVAALFVLLGYLSFSRYSLNPDATADGR